MGPWNKPRKTFEVIKLKSMPSDNYGIKLEITNTKIYGKYTNIINQNNTYLKSTWVKVEVRWN